MNKEQQDKLMRKINLFGFGIIIGMFLIAIPLALLKGVAEKDQKVDTSIDKTKYYIQCDITGKFEYTNKTFIISEENVNISQCKLRKYYEAIA